MGIFFQSNSAPPPFQNWLTLIAACAIASCVSELLLVTSKSSDEEKGNFLARVKCPSRDLPLVLTDNCKISIMMGIYNPYVHKSEKTMYKLMFNNNIN